MKKSTKILMLFALLAVVVFFAFLTKKATIVPERYDQFAQCLTASGAKMYGAYWCPQCQNQKKLFGSSFQYIHYVECDPRGNNANPEACDAAGVEGYPTWVFGNGEQRSGEMPLRELAFRSDCAFALPEPK